MLKEENFFKSYFENSKKYKVNIARTKNAFKYLLLDIKNFEIPLLESYDKDYSYTFSNENIKKFKKFKNIIVIGMGGSILGTKTIYSFLKKKIKKKIFFFDNLDANLNYKKIESLKNSCFIIISKSGNTLETIVNLSTFPKKYLLKKNLIIITENKDSALDYIANRYNAEIIEHKEYMGGRYSVLSETGMVPAALMGLNLKKFKNLSKLIKNKNFVNSLIKNVAGIYTLSQKGISNSVILNYKSDLNNLVYWYQQLVAESLGKDGKGIYPSISFGPKDNHSLFQLYLDGKKDKFFTFLNISDNKSLVKIFKDTLPKNMNFLKNKNLEFVVNAQYKATKNIFKLNKIPFREISFKERTEEKLGEIFTFFVLETILLAKLMNVDPFNQPAVEQVKNETNKFLK